MSVREFLDTNVLLYAYDASHPGKQKIAQRLVSRALTGNVVISTQVLAEFAATLLHKISPRARAKEVAAILASLAPIETIATSADVVRKAVEAHAAYGIHFYDGMIVAAADRAGCQKIWSEDFNAGQKYFGIVVENPF